MLHDWLSIYINVYIMKYLQIRNSKGEKRKSDYAIFLYKFANIFLHIINGEAMILRHCLQIIKKMIMNFFYKFESACKFLKKK